MLVDSSNIQYLANQLLVGPFFEDSGAQDASPVVALGGVLGTGEEQDLFEKEITDRDVIAQLADNVRRSPALAQDASNGEG